MLQIKEVCKQYQTGSLVQQALDHVSLNLRDSEFVAILGPSGSGKTTLLNMIGGLDRYDSGDLVINGISTRQYTDRDWDSYRNHTIGFVFQSYNLIPHQTVLANVELALTISGVSKAQRRKRAIQALTQVGLGDQLHKKPSQMSGGQMQRVALARALVNDPDVLLADEPTGALDSETSVQVMELLKQVSEDRLVVMVTHNPELAEAYATRIVRLKDGRIRSDSNPYAAEGSETPAVHKNMGKSSMSFRTALSLSFNNLKTKKARTLLTSFAGSIGIIGIALILSMSNGVNAYIQSVEEDTLSEYPLQITGTGINMTAVMPGVGETPPEDDTGEVRVAQMITNMFSRVDSNDLASLKTFLDSEESGIRKYTNSVEYAYSVTPQIYRLDGDGIRQVHPDNSFAALGLGASTGNSFMSAFMNTNVFFQMPKQASLYESQYDVKAGRWPETPYECVLVLSAGGRVSDFLLYTLGLRDAYELDDMIRRFAAEESVETPSDIRSYRYDEFLGITFSLVSGSDYYVYDETYGVWKDKTDDDAYMRKLVENGEPLTIVGVVQPSKDATATMLSTGICYPAALGEQVMAQAAESEIVRQQLANPGTDVITGKAFGDESGDSAFRMDSLFSVDEEALGEAFQFDSGALDMDFSGYFHFSSSSIDLSELLQSVDFSPELPGLDAVDWAAVLSQIQVEVSPENAGKLVEDLLSGYQDYVADHPEADYSKLGESFLAYLQTDSARSAIEEGVRGIVTNTLEVAVDPSQLNVLVQDVMSGFRQYADDNGLTDPDRFGEYLLAYLQTAEAQQKLTEGAAKIVQVSGEVSISQDQLRAVADTVVDGYMDYAAANGLPDPSQMGEGFSAYLQTPEAQEILRTGVREILDLELLESQLSAALKTALEPYSDAISAQLQSLMDQVLNQIGKLIAGRMSSAMRQLGKNLGSAIRIDPDAFAGAIQMEMTEGDLSELLRSLMSKDTSSLDGNLRLFGYADPQNPGSVSIYPKDFESKAAILAILDGYNQRMEQSGQEEKVIRYTDMVGTLMSSVTDIVDIISYVLVAFVAISLVVSSIMIGVITYISVLERNKEIGILRAIGASKRNISHVFNAETFIIGLASGLIGIGMTLVLLIPANMLIHSLAGQNNINAVLPVGHAVVLVTLSVLLTMVSGLIPSKKAANRDPVAALRSE